ncbi:PqqD family protein [Aurantiacibacter sp. MUD61]|uniref:PqqD family protein n=1 Tax=Aurantiacibacter sp. MUD61 TaxID=3009083 RepID=UPI0022F0E508|nr:PqqD family protein [Aurantiacibacter sp. MUD61]
MEISNDTEIRKTDNFVETVVDDELVLLHIINGQFYSLKDTGRRAWELLEDNKQFGSLVNAMCGEYEVAEDTCREELGKLFGDLQERTLVEIN